MCTTGKVNTAVLSRVVAGDSSTLTLEIPEFTDSDQATAYMKVMILVYFNGWELTDMRWKEKGDDS